MVEREQLVAMVQGMQAGDEAATALMYETFHEDFYYFILKTVHNDRELAMDLTQDTFADILENIGELEEPAAFVTWAKQIAFRRCTRYFKKKKELLLDENEDGTSAFDIQVEENAEFIPDEALDNKELKQTIMAMINDLPEEQRAALLLRYFNEISVKEIAQIQNVSEGTIKSRLNYARKSIKQAVESYEKKNGVKLHCAGVLPVLLWLFREYRVANKLSMAAGTAAQSFVLAEETAVVAGLAATGGAAAGATATTAATATTSTAASAAATAAASVAAKTAVGAGIKAAATALSTKVIASVVAASVVVGGVALGVQTNAKKNEPPKETSPVIPAVQPVLEEEENTVPEETVMIEQIVEETLAEETEEILEETNEATEAITEAPAETTHVHNWFYEVGLDASCCLICGELTYERNPVGAEGPGYASDEEVLENIKQQQGFTTDQEAIDYLNGNSGTTEPPTESPTEAPTEPPTEPPTEAPTEPPTEAPADNPVIDEFIGNDADDYISDEEFIDNDVGGYASDQEVLEIIKQQQGFTTDQEAMDYLRGDNG